ncbi:MAG: PIN domain-containing protein [Synergistaceae bacterium]|jgi:predicted nucleic acid-binding protein|nr:PIN domain-containing protein [Synergistaceae bacterium]
MESESVLAIIDRCEIGDWDFFGSDVLFDEMSMIADKVKKQKILLLCQSATLYVELTEEIVTRAKELEKHGIKPYDALHVASAEFGEADIFLTTDRRLLNATQRVDVKIKINNPLKWLMEVLYEQ